MNQIDRIQRMEQILDESKEAVQALSDALERYIALQPDMQALTDYYDSSLWRQDFSDDEAGKIPSGLKRGVLSEDAVYNLLADDFALKQNLESLLLQKNRD